MKKAKTDIKHLATLANLPLSAKEEKEYALQLEKILKYIGEIQTLNLGDTDTTSQVGGKMNEFREDKITQSLSQKEALSQATKKHNGYFVVERVLND